MISWLLRILGIAAHEVVCLLCGRKIAGEKAARAARWVHTLAGWECQECVQTILRMTPRLPRV